MGFALLGYQGTPGVNASSFDLSAVSDPDFSQRNSHYIFTELYRLLAAYHQETSATGANFSCPTWNAIGKANIWPVNRSVTQQSPPRVDTRFEEPPLVPVNEEFQFQVSNNLGAATEQAWGFILLATRDWTRNLPKGQLPILVRATASPTAIAVSWSGGTAITFDQSLRGGVYAVVGAEVQGANALAFRIIFPRYKLYNGRKLRPGWLCQNAIGDLIYPLGEKGPFWLGEWGRFHTFEPPQIEIAATAGGAISCEIRLWLMYLGESVDLLQGGMGGGGLSSQQMVGVGY